MLLSCAPFVSCRSTGRACNWDPVSSGVVLVRSSMVEALELDPYQAACIADYRSGKNLGIFSSAGCGKSVVLRAIIDDAVSRYGVTAVAVCSWYGAAADLIGGHTWHHVFQCGIRLRTPDEFLALAKARPHLCAKLRQIRVLVVDEVFTMTAAWLAVFLRILRGVAPAHGQTHPAGGVQVISMLPHMYFLVAESWCFVRRGIASFFSLLEDVSLTCTLPIVAARSGFWHVRYL